MSVNNHDIVNTVTPNITQARKRLLVPIWSANGPEIIIPKGIAAVERAKRTEFTLPCICSGTKTEEKNDENTEY